MGIRFHCPNGHKLNVKSFLAGKKGSCPDCGVKLRIPERSEPGLDSGINEEQPAKSPAPAAAATVPPAVAHPAVAPAALAPAVLATPATNLQPAVMPHPAPRPAVIPAGVPVSPTGYPLPSGPVAAVTMPPPYGMPTGPAPAARMPQPPPAPPPMPGMGGAPNDPITENPLATWFVRPPSGGQFGPARGEVMRKWLTEGRVTNDSLVWREGWADWLPATEVFPQLGKPATAGLFGVQPLGASTGTKSTASIPAAKKSSGAMAAAILVFLALICLLLVGVLVVVLSGGISST
jgi:hypothetical protein